MLAETFAACLISRPAGTATAPYTVAIIVVVTQVATKLANPCYLAVLLANDAALANLLLLRPSNCQGSLGAPLAALFVAAIVASLLAFLVRT